MTGAVGVGSFVDWLASVIETMEEFEVGPEDVEP